MCAMFGGIPALLVGAPFNSWVERVGRLQHWAPETRTGIVVIVACLVWVLASFSLAIVSHRLFGYPKRPF